MKIDYHCHILPGIDDGAKDLQDSIMLAKAQLSWGFERVYCTSHITSAHPNTPETIRPAFEALQEALYLDGCPLEIKMSAEYRIVPETWPEVLEKNWIWPIEDKYLLMEMPISKRHELGHIEPVEEFRKVIAPALERVPESKEYYDTWGARAYLYSGTDLSIVNGSRTYSVTDQDIYIDIDAFKALGGRYIFSRIYNVNVRC